MKLKVAPKILVWVIKGLVILAMTEKQEKALVYRADH